MDQRIFLTDRADSRETGVKLLTTKRFGKRKKKKQAVLAITSAYYILTVKWKISDSKCVVSCVETWLKFLNKKKIRYLKLHLLFQFKRNSILIAIKRRKIQGLDLLLI